jgi:hypothetical protein
MNVETVVSRCPFSRLHNRINSLLICNSCFRGSSSIMQ